MARLILKSPYIKSTGGASGYLRYIATRERVELIPDDRPPTRKQEQLIAKLLKDFPDSKTLYEYEDYLTKPTKVNASAFITLALEANWDSIHESEQYMKYIATRPHAERIGAHGLFGDEDAVSLEKAMEELENYTGNVWTHIICAARPRGAASGAEAGGEGAAHPIQSLRELPHPAQGQERDDHPAAGENWKIHSGGREVRCPAHVLSGVVQRPAPGRTAGAPVDRFECERAHPDGE